MIEDLEQWLMSWASPWNDLICLSVAMVAGAIVGFERERKDKPAGLRTLTIICLGSALFARLSTYEAFGSADPGRVAAQVASGVGFLGAGAILRERGTVLGLTTAAMIWVVAAIGVCAGAGKLILSLIVAIVVPLGTLALGALETLVRRLTCHRSAVEVRFRTDGGKARARIQRILDGAGSGVKLISERPAGGGTTASIIVRCCTAHPGHRSPIQEMAEEEDVLSVEILADQDPRIHA